MSDTNIWLKQQLKYNSFDVYHIKCNFPQKRTVYELSAIQKRWSSSKKCVFGKKCANRRKKTFFSALFFRETAVQFQIKYDELQNPKTCKQHYGGCFWSNKVGKLWIFMFGAIFGEIRTWWARTRHFRTSFELILDAMPCFLPLPHQTKLLPTFPDRFKKYSSISEDPLESYPSYFL